MASKDKNKKYRSFAGSIFNVNKNTVLVLENRFTHKVITLESGMRVIPPFYAVKEIVNAAGVRMQGSAKEFKCSTRENYDISCDFSWELSIVDPIKYVYSSAGSGTPSEVLISTLKSCFTAYIKENTYNTLSQKGFDASSPSPAIIRLRTELANFETTYGVRVHLDSIKITDLIPAKEIEEANRQKAAQKAENAKIRSVAKAEAEAFKIQLQALVDAGFSKDEAVSIMIAKTKAEKVQTINEYNIDPSVAPGTFPKII